MSESIQTPENDSYRDSLIGNGLSGYNQLVETWISPCRIAYFRERFFQTFKEPFFLGIAVFLYGITFSLNTGYAINPARDLGPRIFIQLAGFPRAFTRGNDTFDNYWWIPLLGPEL